MMSAALCSSLNGFFLLKADYVKIIPVKFFFLDKGSDSDIYYVNWFLFSSQLQSTKSKTVSISRQERKSFDTSFVLQGGLPPQSY